jgi:fido (protein-threonine AMPylation protein)
MKKSFQRPKTEDNLQEREAAGLWKAQAFVKQIGESQEKITLNVISHIHRVFFQNVQPEIAGKFRIAGQDFKKLTCITPPPGRIVQTEMYKFWRELDRRLAQIPLSPKGHGKPFRKALEKRNEIIIDIAVWAQYKIASIHPFSQGNGRTARLMTNLILYRYGLWPTDIKYEGENKTCYLNALCEIDKKGDFRSLRQLIIKGITASYKKLIEAQKKAARKK